MTPASRRPSEGDPPNVNTNCGLCAEPAEGKHYDLEGTSNCNIGATVPDSAHIADCMCEAPTPGLGDGAVQAHAEAVACTQCDGTDMMMDQLVTVRWHGWMPGRGEWDQQDSQAPRFLDAVDDETTVYCGTCGEQQVWP